MSPSISSIIAVLYMDGKGDTIKGMDKITGPYDLESIDPKIAKRLEDSDRISWEGIMNRATVLDNLKFYGDFVKGAEYALVQ